jgi:PAS domain S-box-containing protein
MSPTTRNSDGAEDRIDRLERENERLRAIIDYTYDWEYLVGVSGDLVYNSPAFRKITGYDVYRGTDRMMMFENIVVPEDKARVLRHVEEEERGEENGSIEFRIRSKSGEERWISHKCGPAYDAAGNWIGRRASNRDITERKNAELRVALNEKRYRRIFDYSPVALWKEDVGALIKRLDRVDRTRATEREFFRRRPELVGEFARTVRVVEANNAALRMMHVDSLEMFQVAYRRSLLSRGYDAFVSELTSVARGAAGFATETTLVSNRGAERVVQLKWAPVEDEPSDESLAIVSAVDLTRVKRAEKVERSFERKRRTAGALIEAVENERVRISRELHDGVGHLLMVANLKLEMLEKSETRDPEKLAEIKELIGRAGGEVRGIVRSLHPVALDNYGLKNALGLLCREMESAHGLKVNYNTYRLADKYDRRLELTIYRVIQEAFNNVVRHAKATEASLQLFQRDRELSVSIEDNGVGFEAKKELDASEEKGGFGLINMRERVESLGGGFHVESAPASGSEIHFVVPLSPGRSFIA